MPEDTVARLLEEVRAKTRASAACRSLSVEEQVDEGWQRVLVARVEAELGLGLGWDADGREVGP